MADQIKDLLEGMGQTHEEVADFLRGQGIKGKRGNAQKCPVAIYLSGVSGESIKVTYVNAIDYKTCRVYRLGEAVSEFVRIFDLRWYPDLIQGENI